MKRRISEDMHVNVHEILPPSGRLDDNYNPLLTIKKTQTMNKQEIWKKIIHIAITILTAIATTFGVTSCI